MLDLAVRLDLRAMRLRPPTALTQSGNQGPQLFPDLLRRARRRLFDVECPKMVKRIRYVHSYARELCQLFLTHQSEPSAPNNEAMVPVDVEALLPPQTFCTSGNFDFVRSELADMGQ